MPILIKGSGGGNGVSFTITVLAETGSSVTATKGAYTVSGIAANDVCVLEIPEDGTWTVTVTNGESSVTDTVVVSANVEFNGYLDPVFANNSWEKIISACESNKVPSTWAIGDQKIMTINNRDYLIDIIGKNRDTYTAGGTAPLTFQMHDCYEIKYRMSITTSDIHYKGWKDSEMRMTTLPAILNLLPSNVQAAIKQVNKLSVYRSERAGSEVTVTTADKLFLLDSAEIMGSEQGYTQYDYYYNGNTKVKKIGSVQVMWWTRKRATNTDSYAIDVEIASITNSEYVGSEHGVSFAFCF